MKKKYGKVTIYDSAYFPDSNKSHLVNALYAIHDDLPNVEFQIHWNKIYAVGKNISKAAINQISNEVYNAFYAFDKKRVSFLFAFQKEPAVRFFFVTTTTFS